ncbi:WG repeat-containing protein [Reichenbachiella agarivorans]|uniref:WG repeat-containing protein n=1 Tax=Reichenbachiella agarivorans TaxID=2979464 RepID=A0ABY6CUY0_9BACT|nr:WG repeat-containing protein [Reichenbachiella agarivorans]UXP33248.1 WG repeat-containing protein [Reichenbachiella agarivorans]
MKEFKRRSRALALLICLLPISSTFVYAQSQYAYFQENGKTGLKSTTGEVVISPRFQKLGWSQGQNLPLAEVVGYYDGLAWGLISTKGKRITEAKYYSLEVIQENVILASIKGPFSNLLFYGTINTKGETILDFKNQSIEVYQGLLIVSEKKNHQRYYGLYSATNQELLPKEYKHIHHLHGSLFVFTNNKNQKGVIHKTGKVLINAELDSIGRMVDDHAKVYRSGKTGLIDDQGNYLYEPKFKDITPHNRTVPFDLFEIKNEKDELESTHRADSVAWIEGQYLVLYLNGWAEIFNLTNEKVYSGPTPTDISLFKEHLIISTPTEAQIITKTPYEFTHFDEIKLERQYLFGYRGGAWSIYNAYGRLLTDKKFEAIQTGSNNLIPVKRNGYWGYVDFIGATAVEFKYDQVSNFIGKIASVSYLGYKHLINQFGEVVGEASYDSIWINDNNTAQVKIRTRTDILNYNGAALFQTYNQLIKHELGYREITEEGKMGLISHHGRIIFYPEYEYISDLINDKFLIVSNPRGISVTLADGATLIPFTKRFEDIISISEGLLAIQKNGKYGFINFDQQLIIANRYDSVGWFQDGLAPVNLNGHWGFINKKEQLVIQPNLDSVSHFEHGMSIVKREQAYGLYTTTGQLKIPIIYEHIKMTSNQLFIAKKEGKYGLFDSHGEKLLDISYELITETEDGQLIVQRRGKTGVISTQGRYTIPLKYADIKELGMSKYACKVLSADSY